MGSPNLLHLILGIVAGALRVWRGQERLAAPPVTPEGEGTAAGRSVPMVLLLAASFRPPFLSELRPLAQRVLGDWPRLPAGASVEDAEMLLAVARTRYEAGQPLETRTVLTLMDNHDSYSMLFCEAYWQAGQAWMQWLLDIAPDCWMPYVELRQGLGLIGSLVPAWADETEEEGVG